VFYFSWRKNPSTPPCIVKAVWWGRLNEVKVPDIQRQNTSVLLTKKADEWLYLAREQKNGRLPN
jgi:hypothetical protein